MLFLMVAALICGVVHADSTPDFTPQEREWISRHPVIRVVVNNGPITISTWGQPSRRGPQAGHPVPIVGRGRPPEPGGPSGEPLIRIEQQRHFAFRGVAADYLAEIAAITGIDFVVTLAGNNNLPGIFDALRQGRADLMPTFLLNLDVRDADVSPKLPVSRSYIRIPMVIVTRTDVPHIDDPRVLQTMKVAGSHSLGHKLHSLDLHINFVNAPPGAGLLGVATGRFDAYVCELSSVSAELAENPVTNIKIAGELPVPSEFAMAVGPHMQGLVPVLNRALSAIPAQKRDAIWRKWFRLPYEQELVSSPWFMAGLAAVVLLLVVAGVAICFYYRRFRRIRRTMDALDPHLLSVTTDRNIVITDATEALCKATGFGVQDLVGKPLMALGGPLAGTNSDGESVWEPLHQGRTWRGEVKIVRRDGSTLWAEAVISPRQRVRDNTAGFTVIYQDVSQKKHYEKLVTRDELTALFNRRHFNDAVPEVLKRCSDDNNAVALLLLDVDNFKMYNDTYGHPAGDRVLAAIGKVLLEVFQRSDDLVFRIGGEEFAVAMPVASRDDADLVARKALQAIRELRLEHTGNPPGIVTVSIGVTVASGKDTGELETMYSIADKALYKAKARGRNTHVLL